MKLKGVEIFRVGTWSGSRKVEVTGTMLDEIVSNFANLNSKVSGFGVAAKLGHKTNPGDPALGWATNVYRQGDVALADFDDVPPDIVDRIGKRQYNSVSIEMYPVLTYAGQVFKNVLSGVAFLGSEWPAVKGLKPLSEAESLFSDDAEKLVLTQEINVLKFTQEDADSLVLAAETRVRVELQGKLDAAVAAAAAATTEADTAKAALGVLRTEGQANAFASLIDEAITAGKVLPKSKDSYLAMASTFAGKTDKVKVGDKELTPVEMFKTLLDGLPKVLKFGEEGRSTPDKPGSEGERASDRVHAAALVKQAGDTKLSYEDAVKAVFATDAELKADYLSEIA